MLTGKYQWGLGLIVGVPTLAVILGMVLAFAIVAFWASTHDPDPVFRYVGFGALAAALVVAGSGVLCWYPFSPVREFHAYSEVVGTVAGTSQRLLSDGNGGVNQRVVVHLQGGDLYGCDDSRCTALHVGDTAHLLCKRQYQFRGTSGWACKWEGINNAQEADRG